MPSEAFGSRQKPLSRTPRLACALSHNADLLILDEATAGLDPLARDELLDELRDYASTSNRGVLLSSHITSDLERIADRVVGINAGSIIFDIPREQITDIAGIAHSTANQAQRILACVDGARVAKREFSCYVLVPNRFEFAEPFLVKFGNTKGVRYLMCAFILAGCIDVVILTNFLAPTLFSRSSHGSTCIAGSRSSPSSSLPSTSTPQAALSASESFRRKTFKEAWLPRLH